MPAPEAIPSYGLKWPPNTPHLHRHNYCALHNLGNGSVWHRKQIISAFWPDYQWSRWSERRLRGTAERKWVTWLGPGSSAKSTDAAIQGIQYWLELPDATAVIACSTTMKMLRKRIWSEFSTWHQRIPKGFGNVGELIDSDTMIRWKKGDTKNGIFGMAVEEGPVEEVINNLIGIHTERVWLIIDEMQGIREAILKATANMSKNKEFRFLGIGNPEGRSNPLVRYSEPIGGWESVEAGVSEEWDTHGGPVPGNGLCQAFDGRKSPADDSPTERQRLSFMINKDWIANHIKSVHGNENDPSVWAQCYGFPPPLGIENTVLDEAIVQTFRVREKAVWTHGFRLWASLDPAFEGGDRRVLKVGRFGQVEDQGDPQKGVTMFGLGKMRWVIETSETIDVPVDTTSKEPIHYQIVAYVVKQLRERKITPEFFGVDSSGEGGALCSIFRKEFGEIIEIEFGGKPTERVVNEGGLKTCSEAYDRRVTELHLQVREFAMANSLRGVPEQTIKELCARRTEYRNGKTRVESKGSRVENGIKIKGFKDRMGYSPDDSDATACGVEVCRQHGAIASADGPGFDQTENTWNKQVQETSEEFDSCYSKGYDYSDA